MADLIDEQVVMLKNLLRSAAKELLAHRSGAVIWRDVAEVLVDNDVVVVVRCKDCKHRDFHCFGRDLLDDDFCSYGERKDYETD